MPDEWCHPQAVREPWRSRGTKLLPSTAARTDPTAAGSLTRKWKMLSTLLSASARTRRAERRLPEKHTIGTADRALKIESAKSKDRAQANGFSSKGTKVAQLRNGKGRAECWSGQSAPTGGKVADYRETAAGRISSTSILVG